AKNGSSPRARPEQSSPAIATANTQAAMNHPNGAKSTIPKNGSNTAAPPTSTSASYCAGTTMIWSINATSPSPAPAGNGSSPTPAAPLSIHKENNPQPAHTSTTSPSSIPNTDSSTPHHPNRPHREQQPPHRPGAEA